MPRYKPRPPKTSYVIVGQLELTHHDEHGEFIKTHEKRSPLFKSLRKALKAAERYRVVDLWTSSIMFGWGDDTSRFHVYAIRNGHQRLVASFQPYKGELDDWEQIDPADRLEGLDA